MAARRAIDSRYALYRSGLASDDDRLRWRKWGPAVRPSAVSGRESPACANGVRARAESPGADVAGAGRAVVPAVVAALAVIHVRGHRPVPQEACCLWPRRRGAHRRVGIAEQARERRMPLRADAAVPRGVLRRHRRAHGAAQPHAARAQQSVRSMELRPAA